MRKIFRFFPSKYSKKWLLVLLAYMITISGSFYVGSLLLLGRNMDIRNILSVVVVSFIISLIIVLTGYMNAKIIFASSSLGLIIAIIALFVILGRKTTGWEDLIGPMVFLEVVVLAFLIGVVLEVSVKIIRKSGKEKNKE